MKDAQASNAKAAVAATHARMMILLTQSIRKWRKILNMNERLL
jgi:heme exporter protein D